MKRDKFKNSIPLYLLLFLFLALPSLSKGQAVLDKVVDPLLSWSATHPQEKVHIHMDKPYYIAGDTIWFAGYNVIGHRNRLSAQSGALYVDFLNESDSLIAALKLPMMMGIAKGNIDLPDNLEQGNYRVRAYTQWMRNAGPEYFFDELVIVGNISKGQSTAKAVFDTGSDKKNTKLTTTINFLDVNNKPIVDKQVNYQVKTSNQMLQTGRAKTDDSGNIKIELKTPDEPDSVNTYITSHIELAKNVFERHSFPVKATFAGTDVQFFPESGDMVAGLPTRVAFKAVGTNGRGVDVKGVVKDNSGQVMAEFQSDHAGMGLINLTPVSGAVYKAEITFPDGTVFSNELPAVKDQGYILAAYPQKESDFLLVRILASDSHFKPVSLLAQSHGEVLFAADVSVSKPLTNVRVPLDEFSSGVVQLTLFDQAGNAVNERLVFISKNDKLTLNISADKASYTPRSDVALTLESVDETGAPVTGSFSMSVVDESKVPVDESAENSIFTQLLLKSELRGYIEEPNYYFSEKEGSFDHLDALMMTQGYRRFIWSDLLTGKVAQPEFPAEKLTSTITGRLLNLFGKPVSNGTVTLLSMAAGVALDTITDADGRFVFDNLLLTDSIKFTIQGRTEKKSDKVELLLDGIPGMVITPNKNIGDLSLNIADSIGQYLTSTAEKDDALSKLGLRSRIIRLDEVTVTANRSAPISSNLNGAGRADQVISAAELGSCPTLRMCLEGRLRNVRFKSEQTSIGPVNFPTSTRGGGRMLVAIDSRILNPDNEGDLMDIAGVLDQNMIDPSSIVNIELLYSPALTSMYGQAASNGVIIINTKGWVPGQRSDYSTKLYAPRGYSNMREFYSPKYGISDLIDAQADMRTTIYWNPTVVVKNGSSTVNFVNAGSPGTYRVVVEGITVDGKLGRQVFRYKVE